MVITAFQRTVIQIESWHRSSSLNSLCFGSLLLCFLTALHVRPGHWCNNHMCYRFLLWNVCLLSLLTVECVLIFASYCGMCAYLRVLSAHLSHLVSRRLIRGNRRCARFALCLKVEFCMKD